MISADLKLIRYLPVYCIVLFGMALFPLGSMTAQPVFSNVTHIVTTIVDELDASADSTLGAGTSLREAVVYSNAGDAIVFGPVAAGSIFLTLGELVIAHDLIIDGPGGSVLEINGNDVTRIIKVDPLTSLLISDLTFSSGRSPAGAAILSYGWLSVETCMFRWSTAINNGGAVFFDGDTLRLSQCSFLNNEAFLDGGALYVEGGYSILDRCTFATNTAGGSGGAMYHGGVAAVAAYSTFSGNSAGANGGAMAVLTGSSLVLRNSTVNDNRAANGGGVHNAGTAAVSLSTLSSNVADLYGGGLHNAGTASVDFATVAFNSAGTGGGACNTGTLNTARSIFADNSASTGTDVNGTAVSGGTNLVGKAEGSSGWISNSDLTGTASKAMNAALDELRLNGGLTKTHALLVCSRAVDAADSTGTFNMLDQRGSSRKVNGDNDGIAKPDIGAYEAQGILDTELPTFSTYPGFVVYLDSASGTANIIADTLILGSLDNCEVVSKSLSKTSYSCSDVGTVSVILTVTDRSFNVKSMNVDIMVVDDIPPAMTVPADISTVAGPTSCGAVVNLGTPVVSDACGHGTPTNNAPSVFPVGQTTVMWSVEDNHDNVTYASQLVTVTDTSKPVLTVPAPVVVNTPANGCSIARGLVNLGAATVTDNCSVTITNNAPPFFPLGVTTVLWTASDQSGNKCSGNQTVTVVDQVPPAIFAPADLRLAADPGTCGRLGTHVNLGTASASDNCSAVTVTNNKPSTFPLGPTVITWTATDASNNTATATQTVVVFDADPPTVVAPPDVVVHADPNQCYWTVNSTVLGTATGTDNCATPGVTNSAGSTLHVGSHRIIWTVTDDNGNRSTDVQLVTVLGDAPTITCPSGIVVTTDPGMAGAVVNYPLPTANSSCSDVEVIRTGGLGSGSFFPMGTTTVSYMAIDGSEQYDECSFDVTVEDDEAPQIWVKVAPRYLWPADNKLYDIKATVELLDNVPGVTAVLTSITCNQNPNGDIVGANYNVFDDMFQLRADRDNAARVYTVTYTATDAEGNFSSSSATVTVPTQKPKDVEIEEGELPVPSAVTLAQNYPNPFNPATRIMFGTPDTRQLELVIFDIMGRPVRTLFDLSLDAGTYTVEWDARSDAGELLPSGVYIYQLRAGNQRIERKMLLAR